MVPRKRKKKYILGYRLGEINVEKLIFFSLASSKG